MCFRVITIFYLSFTIKIFFIFGYNLLKDSVKTKFASFLLFLIRIQLPKFYFVLFDYWFANSKTFPSGFKGVYLLIRL
ncbi:MAG: hypothetical protein CSA39_02910 [Flavobacteriales bacterium]|nr:MAG: hypothetical protein CSA39_02910 [Flavobacteriales bacterium]